MPSPAKIRRWGAAYFAVLTTLAALPAALTFEADYFLVGETFTPALGLLAVAYLTFAGDPLTTRILWFIPCQTCASLAEHLPIVVHMIHSRMIGVEAQISIAPWVVAWLVGLSLVKASVAAALLWPVRSYLGAVRRDGATALRRQFGLRGVLVFMALSAVVCALPRWLPKSLGTSWWRLAHDVFFPAVAVAAGIVLVFGRRSTVRWLSTLALFVGIDGPDLIWRQFIAPPDSVQYWSWWWFGLQTVGTGVAFVGPLAVLRNWGYCLKPKPH